MFDWGGEGRGGEGRGGEGRGGEGRGGVEGFFTCIMVWLGGRIGERPDKLDFGCGS